MNVLERLQRLEAQIGSRPQGGAFQLEGGGIFRPELDPLSYLLQHGVDTPRGKIVGIEPPAGELDPVSASLYEEINNIINGKEMILWTKDLH